jgi:hypothetical protein
MGKFIHEDASLQDWITIDFKGFVIFYNVLERVITYQPPFLLDDLDSFLVRKFKLIFLEEL